MKSSPRDHFPFFMVAAACLLSAGCASTRQPGVPAQPGVIVEGEVVRATGSRLSQVVQKGGPAGIAKDMPGVVTNGRGLEREQNDMQPQSPIGGR
jgi:hypothetical protein